MNGALLINKPKELSSFGVIEFLRKNWRLHARGSVPSLGHGGTLDPFATGLLVILVGKAVKLARYFLGAPKCYEGMIRFGETTIPGDPTGPISETSFFIPTDLNLLREKAASLTLHPYLQIPPMHSAKKQNGQRLYELARSGIEVEREPKECHLYEFEILSYQVPHARFRVKCSSGTYIRTLAQDFGKLLGSVALLETLNRTGSGPFQLEYASSLDELKNAMENGVLWDQLPSWLPFDRLLDGYPKSQANPDEKLSLIQGKQFVVHPLLQKMENGSTLSFTQEDAVAIYSEQSLIGVMRRDSDNWRIERVFTCN